jgi:hypothetical protein
VSKLLSLVSQRFPLPRFGEYLLLFYTWADNPLIILSLAM